MSYTVDIFPNPENAPDKPYFTERIFLASCQREINNLDKITAALSEVISDKRTKEVILGALKGQSVLLNSMIYGVKTNQITFTNPDRQTEVTE